MQPSTLPNGPAKCIVLILCFVALVYTDSFSQCGCTFTIPPGAGNYTFDGVAKGVKPGDVICIAGGVRERILFQNIVGTAANPIIVKNCNGEVILGGPTANNAMVFWTSKFFHVTGTGDPNFEYGIRIIGSKSGTMGIVVTSLSSDVEVDHVDITAVGFAGIMAKTDPTSDCLNVAMVRPNFTMYNIHLHHNYVHQIGGEGFYIGNSYYFGTVVYCGTLQYPHEIRGIRIHDNIFDGCGWESIQVGCGVQDVEIFRNKIYNYGTADVNSQNGGIQMGLGTTGKLYSNFIKGNPNGTGGQGIVIQGIGNNYIFNNVVVNSPDESITVNTKPTPLATDIVNQTYLGGIYIINNTIINPGKAAFAEFVNNAPGNVLYNNLVVSASASWNAIKPYTDWTQTNNVVLTTMAAAKFTNPAIDDYSLLSGSPAINAGRDVSSYFVTMDFDNRGRPSGAAWDAGAYELGGNQKPVVTVGANQTLILPTNSTTVSGTASDPDGTIATYLWTKQSGPATATLTNANTATLSLSNLVAGIYVFRLTATDNGGEIGYSEMTVTVSSSATNQPPIANAGADKTITLPTSTTTFTGAGNDPDGTITTYFWTKVSGPAAGALVNPNIAVLSLTGLVQGTYVLRLTVTDNSGDTDTDDVTLTVNALATNQLPVANAGADKNLVLPTNSVNLVGSGSDPDGTITTYLWTKQSGPAAGTLTNFNSATLQLTGLVQGTYTFRLTVTDNNAATAFDEVVVVVSAANQVPVANAGVDRVIKLPTNSLNLPGSGSDPDGSITSYAWVKISGPAAGTLTNANTATLSLSGLVLGTYVFRLTVTDNAGATDTDDVTVTVQANIPPTANAGAAKTLILPINSTTLNGSGTDTDGTITTYLWEKLSGPTASMAGQNTATLSLTNLVEGSYSFRLTVTDNDGATATSTVSVVVFPATTNQAPVVNAGSDITITLPLNSATLIGSATDADGTIASYLWEKISGPTTSLSGTTTSTLSLTNLLEGVYIFRLTATDDKLASTSDDVRVTVTSINQNPLVNAGVDQTITLPLNTTVLTAVASDADGTIATYAWARVSGPVPGESGNATPTLTLTTMVAGIYVYRVTVTDNDGGSSFDDVKVTVQTATNVNPLASAGSDVIIFLPTNSVNLVGSGTDSDGTIATYAWTQLSGGAATLTNANTSVLSLSGLVESIYTFRLTVTDNSGGVGFDDVKVTVNAAGANQPPVANAGPDISITLPINSTNLIGSGSDANGTIATYGWIKVSGPTATLSNESTAVLSLQDLTEGLYVFQLTVTDDQGATDSDLAEVTVLPATVNQSPTVDAGNDLIITLPTNATNLNALASDPDGTIASYTWTKQVGPAATLSGETTAGLSLSDMVEGIYIFRVSVVDDKGANSFSEVKVTVLALGSNQPPIVNAGSDKTLFLPTSSTTLSGTASDANGSIAFYAWSKTSGPTVTIANENTATLTLTNLLAGKYVFRLTATDNDGASSFDEVTVTIFPGTVNQSPIANAGSNQTIVSPSNTTTLTGSGFDPDGSIVAYTWTQISGPSSTLENVNSPTLIVNNLVVGIFRYQLTVEDDKGATGSSIAQITVVADGSNLTPVADAGFDLVIYLPQNSTDIQGLGQDIDGTIATYAWVKKSGPASGTLSGQTTSKLSLAGLVAGTYQFTLTVTDNLGATNSDDVKVTVLLSTVNSNPTVNAGTDIFIRLPVSSTTLLATAADVDGTIATYLWSQQSGPTATFGATNAASLPLTNLVEGTYIFRIEVTDDDGATSADEVTITVAPPGVNAPPLVSASTNLTIVLPTNSTILNGSASDPDGSISNVTWTQQSGPSTATLSGQNSTTLSTAGLIIGTYVFRLTATDNESASAFSEASVEVKAFVPPTVVFAGTDTTLTLPNNVIALAGEVVSTSGLIVSYVWTQVDGPISTMEGTYPDVSLVDLLPGVYTYRFTVTDNFGEESFDDIIITVIEGGSNPIGASLFFSPNGDTFNEAWTIKNLSMITDCPISIFNSLGKKVYEADHYENDWAGIVNGQPLKEGDYYYVIECGNNKTYSGALRLIR